MSLHESGGKNSKYASLTENKSVPLLKSKTRIGILQIFIILSSGYAHTKTL